MNREFLATSKGFSLIEILIAIGLMGLSAMVIAGLFSQQVQMQRFIIKKMDLGDLRRVATDVMADPLSCACNFQGVNVNTGAEFRNLNQIRAQFIDTGAGPQCNTGEVLSSANSTLVENIRMENFRDLGSNRHSYELVFYPRNDPGHVSLQPIRIQNLMVEVLGTTVESCGSIASLAQQGNGPTFRKFYTCHRVEDNAYQDCEGLTRTLSTDGGWPSLTTEERYHLCLKAYSHRDLNSWIRPVGEIGADGKSQWRMSLGAGAWDTHHGGHRTQFTCVNFD